MTQTHLDEVPSSTPALDIWTQRLTRFVTALVRWISVHWLLVANLSLGAYTGLPALAPVLMQTGYLRAANLLYTAFKPLCHQLPERSFFLFGQQLVYSYSELSRFLGGAEVPARYIGAPVLGFKIAVCERDVAINLTMFLFGVVFIMLRRWFKPLPVKAFVAMIIPMAIDGTGQLIGLWTSTWWSRLGTGFLFGLACVWLTYPYVEQGMNEVRTETARALQQWQR